MPLDCAAMDETLRIRPATMSDHAAFAALLAELDGQHHAALPKLMRPAEDSRLKQRSLEREIDSPDALVLAAEHGGVIVGFIHARLVVSKKGRAHLSRRTIYIEEIVVTGEARRRGIGRALMADAMAWARERDATAINLNVYEFNEAAHAFYESLGFQTLVRRYEIPVA